MILTCPECATSYFVDDSKVPAGRQVKCSNCGALHQSHRVCMNCGSYNGRKALDLAAKAAKRAAKAKAATQGR